MITLLKLIGKLIKKMLWGIFKNVLIIFLCAILLLILFWLYYNGYLPIEQILKFIKLRLQF
jgi:hypothetical protein